MLQQSEVEMDEIFAFNQCWFATIALILIVLLTTFDNFSRPNSSFPVRVYLKAFHKKDVKKHRKMTLPFVYMSPYILTQWLKTSSVTNRLIESVGIC